MNWIFYCNRYGNPRSALHEHNVTLLHMLFINYTFNYAHDSHHLLARHVQYAVWYLYTFETQCAKNPLLTWNYIYQASSPHWLHCKQWKAGQGTGGFKACGCVFCHDRCMWSMCTFTTDILLAYLNIQLSSFLQKLSARKAAEGICSTVYEPWYWYPGH